jgi:serine/threonine protein kinase
VVDLPKYVPFNPAAPVKRLSEVSGSQCGDNRGTAPPTTPTLSLKYVFSHTLLLTMPPCRVFMLLVTNSLHQIFTAATDDTVDLLSKMIQLIPSKRLTTTQCLAHPYFKEEPAATEPFLLPLDAIKNKKKGR